MSATPPDEPDAAISSVRVIVDARLALDRLAMDITAWCVRGRQLHDRFRWSWPGSGQLPRRPKAIRSPTGTTDRRAGSRVTDVDQLP